MINESEAVENFFHEFIVSPVRPNAWGPELWEQHGFTIADSRVKILDEQKWILFVLRYS